MQHTPAILRPVWGIKGRRPYSYIGQAEPNQVHDFGYSLNTYGNHAEVCAHLMSEEPGTECWPYQVEA